MYIYWWHIDEQKMTRAQAAEVIMKLLDFWEKERQQFLENMKKK
jgi:hypothetical protein